MEEQKAERKEGTEAPVQPAAAAAAVAPAAVAPAAARPRAPGVEERFDATSPEYGARSPLMHEAEHW